jgi:hypothetical protein
VASKGLAGRVFGSVAMIGVNGRFPGSVAKKGVRGVLKKGRVLRGSDEKDRAGGVGQDYLEARCQRVCGSVSNTNLSYIYHSVKSPMQNYSFLVRILGLTW